MRIAITGGTGFVGTHLAALLVERGHQPVLVARGRRRRPGADGLPLVQADVVTGAGLPDAFTGCDAVVHLAAVIVERRGRSFDTVNRQGTANVARAAGEAGASHLVLLSAVGAGPDPRYSYLESKWGAEQEVRISGVPHTILRSSLIFGPGDGFFTKLRKLVRLTPPLLAVPVAGDGRALFQPIGVQDVARCIALALERGPSQRVIAVGGPEHLSYQQIIDIIRRRTVALPRWTVHVPVPLILPPAAVMAAIVRDPLVTPSQLAMLRCNNVTLPGAVEASFGFTPISFTQSWSYLRDHGGRMR